MRDEARRVHDQEVFDVVATVPGIEHGGARVIAHARAARLVSDAPQRVRRDSLVGKNLRPRGVKDLLHAAVHFLQDGERMFVLGIGMKADLRNAVPVCQSVRVNLDVVPVECQTLTVPAHG